MQRDGCRALVRTDTANRQVRIYVDGPENNRRELLGIIRYNLEFIHTEYKLVPDELVFVAGKPQSMHDLVVLRESGKTTVEVVSGSMLVKKDIAKLQNDVASERIPLKLFLSYAHADEDKYIQELRKRLKILERNGDILPWSDHGIAAGEKWETRILMELAKADAIVCQLTADFLASDFCMFTELQTAIRKANSGEGVMIAYSLKTSGWKRVKELAQFQILPKPLKPVIQWKDQGAYWEAVVDGIETALQNLQKDPRFQRKRK